MDERFKDLPFVAGPPHFRFYAGTPLTTNKGINIGSLFVLDDRVRPKLNPVQVDFLGTVAGIIMRNMELHHEAEERKRSLQMSRALNAFQEGKDTVDDSNGSGTSSPNIRRANMKKSTQQNSNHASLGKNINDGIEQAEPHSRRISCTSPHIGQPTHAENGSDENSPALPKQIPLQVHNHSLNAPFLRASRLLRQCLDLQETGGVVFLDSNPGFQSQDNNESGPASVKSENILDALDSKSPLNGSFRHRTFSKKNDQAAEIIGISTPEFDFDLRSDPDHVRSFSPVDQHTLQRLAQHYPRGKLWSFDDDGMLSNCDEDLLKSFSHEPHNESAIMRHQRKQTEATLLSRCFPKGIPFPML